MSFTTRPLTPDEVSALAETTHFRSIAGGAITFIVKPSDDLVVCLHCWTYFNPANGACPGPLHLDGCYAFIELESEVDDDHVFAMLPLLPASWTDSDDESDDASGLIIDWVL
jgi:hypothetical protein